MTKLILGVLVVTLAMFSQLNFCGKDQPSQNNANSVIVEKPEKAEKNKNTSNAETNKNVNEKTRKISELNIQKPEDGIFAVKGFVVKTTDCPACPPDAQCKPCMAENLLVSETNKTLNKYDLTDSELIIFTKKSESFAKGKEYNFIIKITDRKTTSSELNDIELISAEAINN